MKKKKMNKAGKSGVKIKKYDLANLLEYVEKHMKPHPHWDVVKWLEKHGR